MRATGTPPTGVIPVEADWHAVREHYEQRHEIHQRLISLHDRALSNSDLIRPFVLLHWASPTGMQTTAHLTTDSETKSSAQTTMQCNVSFCLVANFVE
jgi:hypothetical protein